MSSNKHWPRWIFASVSKHFKDRLTSTKLYIEGQHRDVKIPETLFELRVDGPYLTEISKDLWHAYTEISVLVQVLKNDKNYHTIHSLCGEASAAMDTIELRKYGNGPDDDATFVIGCMRLVQSRDKRERVQINHFGQIETSTPLMQASVEAHFQIELDASP